jgi:hypothetical protein
MSSNTEMPLQTASQALPPHIAAEHVRAKYRRTAMGIARPQGHRDAPWALALSGGGIRSATFCLGVLQGLALAEAPQAETNDSATPAAPSTVLPQFDYLSTVSGGGYIGGFFSSLFRPGRLNKQVPLLDDKATVWQAYTVFKEDPPGRLHGALSFDPACPGKAPLAWLRENGRYMAPTGSGDMVYAAAVGIRNWCAMHYVLGTTFLAGYLLLAFSHVAIMRGLDFLGWSHAIFKYEVSLLTAVMAQQSAIWWSPAWWLILPLMALWLLPAGAAYWMTHPPQGHDVTSPPTRFSKVSIYAVAAGFLAMAYAWFGERALGIAWKPLAQAFAAIGFVTVAGVVWHWVTCSLGFATISAQRVFLTRSLAKSMLVVAGLASFALVHTVAQTLYVSAGSIQSSFGSAVAVAATVWGVRRLTAAFEEKEREGWLAKIPVENMVTVAGATLLFLVALFWALVVLWIQWHGDKPRLSLLENSNEHLIVVQVLGVTCLLVVELVIVLGRFPGFLNLSTLQGLYSARLTRAYMGASNGIRFDPRMEYQHLRSVAEPHKDDHMTLDQLYENPLAPMHIINVCLNQNIDAAEQLVQRDRKGRPLAIVPNGFALDGTYYAMPEEVGAGALTTRLTVGEWIGVSGAAFSTGMGRDGGIGRSLLLGLANVRLGRWWQSGIPTQKPGPEPWLRRTFKTQTYLLDELFAKFYGTRRPLQYLSDGGHFENMALYELVRPQRGIRLTVACDCGCDPQYQFADLANLIRMARIDFGTEIEVDSDIAEDEILGKVFGTIEQFLPGCEDEHAVRKCALLLNVYHSDESYRAKQPNAQIIVIKPRVTPDAYADIAQYQNTHTEFPQEPTADQFYDEAQWESYRKLGLEISKTVFGAGPDGGTYRDALWSWVLNVELATGNFVLGSAEFGAATADGKVN